MAVCYRLISDNLSEVDHQCSLCLFLTGSNGLCQHTKPAAAISRTATATPFSECSFYTCRTAASTLSTTSISSGSSRSSSSTIKGRLSNSSSTNALQQHSLRRRQSPTELSLRELNRKQAGQLDLRQRQSEEALQQVYERQILQYLNSNVDLSADYDDLWTIEE
ncbi:hypothetical protein Slin15195_G098400 [Septoria linicola]|uniref:Uncharacterized protein n=1 Tax=Septoria linicola TaxID=215465 RepID=A0A9Q9EM71_9PEZI|nr:hypothetical protein Slin14017_G061460 [Septoria linicola]USW56521.1 hypothetical protein Slin15195_G098400 [Septoria linicola]